MNSTLWTHLPAYIAALGALVTAIATYLLWKSTKEMANSSKQMAEATKNMEQISKDMKQESEKSLETHSAVTLMQMLNSANALAVESEENLKIFNELIEDKILQDMLKEIDENVDTALKKVWIAFIWLNTEQSQVFLKEIIPPEYTKKTNNEVLRKTLQHKFVRYLVSNRGYYDLFIKECIEIYEESGKEWEQEWKSKNPQIG